MDRLGDWAGAQQLRLAVPCVAPPEHAFRDRPDWPDAKKKKLLIPLSQQERSTAAYETGEVFHLVHDQDACNTLIEWIKAPWTGERLAAWNLWITHYFPLLCKAWRDGTIYKLSRKKKGSRSVMEQVLQCLDEMFFGGQVSPYCTFQWIDDINVQGLTSFFDSDPASLIIQVNLNTIPNAWKMVGTLLHELCHAHWFLYGCQGGLFCGICAKDSEPEDPPFCEHPDAFFELSGVVENIASTRHGSRLSLNRAEAFVERYVEAGISPQVTDVLRFFTRKQDIKSVMRLCTQKLWYQTSCESLTEEEFELPSADDMEMAKLPLGPPVAPPTREGNA
jgi:hypothetical protein